jgi:hypothetical protein
MLELKRDRCTTSRTTDPERLRPLSCSSAVTVSRTRHRAPSYVRTGAALRLKDATQMAETSHAGAVWHCVTRGQPCSDIQQSCSRSLLTVDVVGARVTWNVLAAVREHERVIRGEGAAALGAWGLSISAHAEAAYASTPATPTRQSTLRTFSGDGRCGQRVEGSGVLARHNGQRVEGSGVLARHQEQATSCAALLHEPRAARDTARVGRRATHDTRYSTPAVPSPRPRVCFGAHRGRAEPQQRTQGRRPP